MKNSKISDYAKYVILAILAYYTYNMCSVIPEFASSSDSESGVPIWVIGTFVLIVIICLVVGVNYIEHSRRKNVNNLKFKIQPNNLK